MRGIVLIHSQSQHQGEHENEGTLRNVYESWKLTNAVISKMEKRENAHDPIRCTIFGVLYNKVFDDIRGLQCIGGLIPYVASSGVRALGPSEPVTRVTVNKPPTLLVHARPTHPSMVCYLFLRIFYASLTSCAIQVVLAASICTKGGKGAPPNSSDLSSYEALHSRHQHQP